MKSLNWFRQHPNGTAVIALLLGFTVAGLGSFDAAEKMVLGLGALIYYFVNFPHILFWKELMFVLIGLGLCLPVLGWTFKQKKGSTWWPGWIVLTFIPFGWVAGIFIGRPVVTVLNFGRPIIVPSNDKEIFDIKYWRGIRQAICWAGIVAFVVLVVLAWTLKDYSHVPLWVRIGQSFPIFCVIGGFLLYGALRK